MLDNTCKSTQENGRKLWSAAEGQVRVCLSAPRTVPPLPVLPQRSLRPCVAQDCLTPPQSVAPGWLPGTVIQVPLLLCACLLICKRTTGTLSALWLVFMYDMLLANIGC